MNGEYEEAIKEFLAPKLPFGNAWHQADAVTDADVKRMKELYNNPLYQPLVIMGNGSQRPDMLQDVADFHRAMDVLPGPSLTVPGMARVINRADWLRDEVLELEQAAGKHDIAHYVREAIDIMYFALGFIYDAGVTPEQFYRSWSEVQRANMSKAGGPVASDGKRLKPAGWQEPNIGAVLHS